MHRAPLGAPRRVRMEAWRSGVSSSRGPDLQTKSLIPGGLLMEAARAPHERFVDVTPISLRRLRPLQRLVRRARSPGTVRPHPFRGESLLASHACFAFGGEAQGEFVHSQVVTSRRLARKEIAGIRNRPSPSAWHREIDNPLAPTIRIWEETKTEGCLGVAHLDGNPAAQSVDSVQTTFGQPRCRTQDVGHFHPVCWRSDVAREQGEDRLRTRIPLALPVVRDCSERLGRQGAVG